MRLALIIAAITLLTNAPVLAAEEKTVTAPFPKIGVPPVSGNLYCNATLGTVLEGRSNDHKLVTAGVAKAGVLAKSFEVTDRLVIEVLERKLYMFRRDEFETGKSSRDFPLEIIENSRTNLVAVVTGLIAPKGATIFTLNRKTGVGSWTSVMSVGLMTDSPRIEAIYLTCGARRD